MFQENFPTNTQVWNSPLPSKWQQTQRSHLSYLWVLQQQPVIGQELQSSAGRVFYHVHGLGRQPTDLNWTQLRSQRLQHYDDSWSLNPTTPSDGHSNESQNRKEARTFSSARQPVMLVNGQKSSHIKTEHIRVPNQSYYNIYILNIYSVLMVNRMGTPRL